MEKMYECNVQLGSRRDRRFYWVKGARWEGDSVVVDLSPERCFIPQKLSSIATTLLFIAENRPRNYISVSCCEVTSSEFDENHPDLLEKYKAFVRSYVDAYGFDAVRDICSRCGIDLETPSEVVTSNE